MGMIQKQNIHIVTFDNLTNSGLVKHGFTTRHGGVSTGYFATMNMGFSRGEQKETVAENYRLLAKALELDENKFVTTQQTHTTNILKVTQEYAGFGVTKQRTYANIDGLITNEPNLNLVIFGADCVPIFFLDTKQKAIGMAHCGWKGTANRMAEKMVLQMQSEFDTNPKDLIVGIGPSIGKCCFQIDAPVIELFEQHIPFTHDFLQIDTSEKGKYKMDLWGINRRLLEDLGVNNIEVSGLCTMCDTQRFYSHRKMGEKRGVMAGVMTLR